MSLRVATAQPYEVRVEAGALDHLSTLIADASRVAIIFPEPLRQLAGRVAACVEAPLLLAIPDAEAAKTPQVLESCWAGLAEAGFTRNDVVVGVGGGTATDLAGFVAATWLRGVAYVSVPTTVLAMVDAAVGGKTGINLPAGKNLVGAFYEPRGVLCDLDLLAGLPQVEVRSGLAEVIKAGFIADAAILAHAQEDIDQCQDIGSARFADILTRAIAVKAAVVAEDLTERTSQGDRVGREALNYGHTLGHAIEASQGYRMRHGEAISIGMCWIAEVSRRELGLEDHVAGLHRELLRELRLPTSHDPAAFPRLRQLMSLDKKARGARLRLVGLRAQGQPSIISSPDEELLAAAYTSLDGQL
ncbi:MAG: 3-dehydroquinate synthase [Arachnia sp.]